VSRLQAALASADAANRAKRRFLAMMSHELRSPLNAIIGFSEMIRDEVAGPLGAVRYKDWSADINTAGKHLLTLITDLLDFSKLEADRLALDVDVVDLGDLAASCLIFVAPRAEKYGIALTLDVQPSTGVFLHGDARLGLPLAKALAEKHGGLLEIDSAIGKGTTVRVCLPAARRCAVSALTKSDITAEADNA
jgi:signal transduction histidine kinase